jgi:hypothetical protein
MLIEPLETVDGRQPEDERHPIELRGPPTAD